MQRRQAFTLVELLVSMALILFIMVLLTQAFVVSLETFRQLKAIGDLESQLRVATTSLRSDLSAEHFDGNRKLSDPDFWVKGPPREGFFRIWQSTPGRFEGLDSDNVPLFRATDHALHFTVRLRGNKRENFFSASSPDRFNQLPTDFFGQAEARFMDTMGRYNCQWGEVVYFLRRTGTTVSANDANSASGVPLYTLYRRVVLLVPNNATLQRGAPPGFPADGNGPFLFHVRNRTELVNLIQGSYAEFSCNKEEGQIDTETQPPVTSFNAPRDRLHFNTPSDVTMPPRRFGMHQGFFAGVPIGQFRNLAFGKTPASLGYQLDQAEAASYPVYNDPIPGTGNQSVGDLVMLGQALPSGPSPLLGVDALLPNVVSFEVSVLREGATDFMHLNDYYVKARNAQGMVTALHPCSNPRLESVVVGATPAAPDLLSTVPLPPRVFDTWTSGKDEGYDYINPVTSGIPAWNTPFGLKCIPFPVPAIDQSNPSASVMDRIRIIALKITLRVFDTRTQTTRQVTLIQDM